MPLIVHNRYQQRGGEDEVFRAEVELLRAGGHRVVEYVRSNEEIASNGFVSRARLAAGTIWARDSYRELHELIAREKPDVAHFHNTLPLISPAAYYACHDAGVPVVQTLHNYRLFCPAATFFRRAHVCEECVEHSLLRGVGYGCYRGSRAATAAVATMLKVHRVLGTWRGKVDVYIALSEFARQKFMESGLPGEKIVIKPNFVHPDPGLREGAGEYALFVGRLSEEKGLRTLLTAWKRLGTRIPLRIVGDGPLRTEVEGAGTDLDSVHTLGRLPREQTIMAMKGARFLVFPSECFENFPVVIAEAFACGVPLIASRLGAMVEIVADGRTGLHFTPGDADDLAAEVEWAWSHSREMGAMGRNARLEYESKYTADRNYEQLLAIYQKAAGAGRLPVRGYRT
ncbi:MAG: glycosyltransferase family 4 protein [Acidobacteria bacterium]|nr:glycosyltransferase family 4 protein [Acidobacteriota bacterium]